MQSPRRTLSRTRSFRGLGFVSSRRSSATGSASMRAPASSGSPAIPRSPYREGRFTVHRRGHAFAVIDGVVHDWARHEPALACALRMGGEAMKHGRFKRLTPQQVRAYAALRILGMMVVSPGRCAAPTRATEARPGALPAHRGRALRSPARAVHASTAPAGHCADEWHANLSRAAQAMTPVDDGAWQRELDCRAMLDRTGGVTVVEQSENSPVSDC